MSDYSRIKVMMGSDGLIINNPTSLPLIGKEHQGAVFKIGEDRCIKIFVKQENLLKEKEVFLKAKGLPFMPEYYGSGPNYIVMEYIGARS